MHAENIASEGAGQRYAQPKASTSTQPDKISPDQCFYSLATQSGKIVGASNVHALELPAQEGDILVGASSQVGCVSSVGEKITVEPLAVVDGSIETRNGDILVDIGCEVKGGIATDSGGVTLGEGTIVHGCVETKSGNIIVGRDCDVMRDIFTAGGDVELEKEASVHGGIYVKQPVASSLRSPIPQPRVVIGPEVVVKGPLEFELPVRLYVHQSARTGRVTGADPVIYATPQPPRH